MARRLVVEREARAVVADLDQPPPATRSSRAPARRAFAARVRRAQYAGFSGLQREQVLDVGEDQLLVLLLVLQPELDQRVVRASTAPVRDEQGGCIAASTCAR